MEGLSKWYREGFKSLKRINIYVKIGDLLCGYLPIAGGLGTHLPP